MAAHQAPPSLGFSRQERWSGLPFPSPMHESESEIAQPCPTLSDPMDRSLPGSSVHGIFQARVLECSAIIKLAAAAVKSLQSCPTLCNPIDGSPPRLRHSWDSSGKNTRVGCHFLLQCMKVKSQSEVVQSCLTLRDPMDCSLPGSSIHGIFQARVLEWVATEFSDY